MESRSLQGRGEKEKGEGEALGRSTRCCPSEKIKETSGLNARGRGAAFGWREALSSALRFG